MDKFSTGVIRHRKPIIIVFIAVALVFLVLQFAVDVNYNMSDYLPPDAQSTIALDIMTTEFGGELPNTNVMVRDVTLQEALDYKSRIAAIDGVTGVMWLDDMADLRQPLEMTDASLVEGYYRGSNALYSVTIESSKERAATNAIIDLVGDKGAVSGEAPNTALMQNLTVTEVLNAMLILVPIIIAILIFSTSSWVEPILFLANIAVAIFINMGTTLFFGEVSFLTKSVSPILQLAVSLDYAIFLLHSFSNYREKCGDNKEAMRLAMKSSVSTIAASAITTLFGFIALAFMNFRIGADLGINLAMGIIISFVTTMVFLPALTLTAYKLIDKTRHRTFFPSTKNINRFFGKLGIPVLILVVLLIVPSFLGQSRTEFLYGGGTIGENTEIGKGRVMIEEEFAPATSMVLLVPRGDVAKEALLARELADYPYTSSVMSYAHTVGAVIPPEYLDESIVEQFYSDNYARIILSLDTPNEGELAFKAVDEIMAIANGYYDNNAYSLGQSANLNDMANVVSKDNLVVTLVAVIAIFVVLLVTFKSVSLPIILLLTIETGIWINLAIPYFTGTPIVFIGYLVLNTVQLGATVDYAILLTTTYMRNRQELPQKEAMHRSMGSAFQSILISATTLATAGFALALTSSNQSVCDIGLLLGRGTILSFVMVVCFLPIMLKICDKLISKTTIGAGFLRAANKEEKHENS